MAANLKAILDRVGQLKSERSTFETHWQQVRDVVLPVVKAFTTTETAGSKGRMDIYDSTPEDMAERLAAALDSMLSGQGASFFYLEPRDKRARLSFDEADWLEHAAETMHRIFNSPASGFRGTIHECYLDIIAFGTAGMMVQDRPGRIPLYQTRPLGELLLTENHEGRVDGVYRCLEMTARQVLQKWPDTAGEKIARMAEKQPNALLPIVHAIYPREERMPGLRRATNLPYASVWLVNAGEAKHLLAESGYHEFPMMVPRWIKRAGEVYGRGPGMKVLPDAKMLQRVQRVTIVGGELVIAPPLLVADDGVLGGKIDLQAGGFTMYRSGSLEKDPIRPLLTGARPDYGEDMMDGIRARIERGFYGDLLRVMQDPKMTATQVIKLESETLRILAPIVGRLQVEMLEPAIERTFGIALRSGLLRPPPDSLQGRDLAIEYLSPVARAARLEEVRAYSQTLEIAMPLADRDPGVLDLFDFDEGVRNVADVLGVPKRLMRSPDAVIARREQRQQAAQQQAATQTAIEAAPAAAKLARAAPELRQLMGPLAA